MRFSVAVIVGIGMSWLFLVPSMWAADGDATPVGIDGATREQIRQTIETTRSTDPELAAEMERQMDLMETGDVEDRDDLLVGPPVEERTDDYLPPEVRAQLEKLFEEQGTGDPAKDAHVREEAERILREHGIEPREWEHGEGFERASEHMSPEAREQMERLYEHEGARSEMDREMLERELMSPERSFEAPERTHETTDYQHSEYEAPPQP